MPVKEMNRKLEKVERASDYNAGLAPVKGGGEEGGPGQMVSDGSNVTEVSIRLMGSS